MLKHIENFHLYTYICTFRGRKVYYNMNNGVLFWRLKLLFFMVKDKAPK